MFCYWRRTRRPNHYEQDKDNAEDEDAVSLSTRASEDAIQGLAASQGSEEQPAVQHMIAALSDDAANIADIPTAGQAHGFELRTLFDRNIRP